MYKAYVDGRSENGKGAWGFILIDKNDQIVAGLSGLESSDSSNMMSLIGANHLLNYLSDMNVEGESIEVYTDSNYLRRGMTEWIEGWMAPDEKGNTWVGARGKPIKYKEIWISLYNHTLKYTMNWDWVVTSVGDKYNERADSVIKSAQLNVRNLIHTELTVPVVEEDSAELTVDDVLDYMFGNESNPEAEQKSISKIEGVKEHPSIESNMWDGILLHPIKSLYDSFHKPTIDRGYVFGELHIDQYSVEVTLICDPYNTDSIANASQDAYQTIKDVYQDKVKGESIYISNIIIEDEKIKCVIWGGVDMNYDFVSPKEADVLKTMKAIKNVGQA